MKNSTTKPPVTNLRQRKNPVNSSKANISFADLTDLFVHNCKRKNLAPETITGYSYAAKRFAEWYGENELYCDDITQDLINDYIYFLTDNYKPQTVNSYQFKLSAVIKFGISFGYIKDNIEFTHCVEQEHIKEIYTADELKVLLKRPVSDSFAEYRDWVIINVLLATGIRAKELRELQIGDVDFDNGIINLTHTKNRKPRIIPIPSSLHIILFEYIKCRNGTHSEPLFCNIFGEPLKRTTLQLGITKYCKKRNVNKYSLHLFRHTFITLSVRNGMSPLLLKRITGHQSLKMLNNYYQFDVSDLTNVVDQYNPLTQFNPKVKKF